MSTVAGDSLPASSVKKCEKFRKLLVGKEVTLSNTGDKLPNQLVSFLTCQVKNSPIPSCKDLVTSYEKCHNSVMGTGSYPATGRRHCGEELAGLYNCVVGQGADS
eukprot:TRINITY_DN11687_c0_g1_i1.p1 TRINITY_DN11687_c0_g1~~TRINITY_DN11687_c0_g1_i1.p1  ORF type:complete len:105 (-),score=38.21 TRINITY_DN11687_c0_g1_i1:62-376(-)